MVTTESWVQHFKSTLQAIVTKSGKAATGARLKAQLLESAAAQNVAIPEEFRKVKFKDWLLEMRAQGHAHVLEREGEDLLVAPAEQPELLINYPERRGHSASIRQDMFQAFTLVGDRKPWFDRNLDKVDWTLDETPPSPDHVRIPSPSFELLRANRERFAASLNEPLREKFRVGLAQPRALMGFAGVVRELGLQSAWHSFRAKELTDAIRQWADQNGVPWSSTWISSGSESIGDVASADSTVSVGSDRRRDKDDFRELVGLLEPEELSSVFIPLNLVVKLLGRVKR